MHGKRPKKKTKRMTLRKKYKIVKKVREHERKLRKEKKKNPSNKSKKDPGVPNSHPFKAKIVAEARKVKKMEEARKERVKQELKMRRKEDRQNTISQNRSISSLMAGVEMQKMEYELKSQIKETSSERLTDTSAKTYYKEFRKLVEAADVVLEVLDSRDPLGSRCTAMEEYVTSKVGKKLVFILSKADLVPKENLRNWMEYLRREKPTTFFKSSTQTQSKRLGHIKASTYKSFETSNCIGADTLLQLLKNYSRNEGIKTAITVGVIGLPNVGKSSLINSLKRSKACNVGATPGVTKNLQKVQLDSKVTLLDCPGIIFPDKNTNDISSSLKNVMKIEQLEDTVTPVEAILMRAGKEQMMMHYNIEQFSDTNEFLSLLACKRGKLKRGGIPDVKAASVQVLRDWNEGIIKYYTRPPPIEKNVAIDTKIVSQLADCMGEFSLAESDQKAFLSLPDINIRKMMCVESSGPIATINEEGDAMDTEESEENRNSLNLLKNVEIKASVPKRQEEPQVEKKPRWETEVKEIDFSSVSLKKLQKKVLKKQRKESNRNEQRTDELTEILSTGLTLPSADDYNFEDYFDGNIKK